MSEPAPVVKGIPAARPADPCRCLRWACMFAIAVPLFAAWALVAYGAFLFCVAKASGAPVIKKTPKPVRIPTCREAILAARTLGWFDGDTVRFQGDGGYEWRGTAEGSRWLGTWNMTGPTTLHVREASLNEADGKLGTWLDWTVELTRHADGTWRGTAEGAYGTVRLAPGKKAKP